MPSLAQLENEDINFHSILSEESCNSFQIHCHNIFEIYYFIEGDIDYLVEGKVYHPTPHSIILLSPHVFHGVRINSEKPYRRFTIHFNPATINTNYRQALLSAFPSIGKHSQKEVYYENTDNYNLHSFFDTLTFCSKQPLSLSTQLLPIFIESLLAQLTIMCNSLQPIEPCNTVSSTITNIISYLNSHLSEKITLDILAERFFISKHYLNRTFKRATGTTVGDYLIYKRVIYANQLLVDGCLATEAATLSGFNDYSAFYRAYHKITGHAPSIDQS